MFNIIVLLGILRSQGDAAYLLSHRPLCHREIHCPYVLPSHAIPMPRCLPWLLTAHRPAGRSGVLSVGPHTLSLASSFIPVLTIDSPFSLFSNIWGSHLFAHTILTLSVSYPSLESYLTLPANSLTFLLWLFSSGMYLLWNLALGTFHLYCNWLI